MKTKNISRGVALAAFAFFGALIACDEPRLVLRDALADGADALDGTVSDASAQAPTSIPVTCTEEASSTKVTGSVTIETTVHYANVEVNAPQLAKVQRCGETTNVQSCPDGSTCTGALPMPDCRIDLPRYTGKVLYVECGRSTTTTIGTGAPTTTTLSHTNVSVVTP